MHSDTHPDYHGACMNMKSRPTRVLLIDDDEDEYVIVRNLLDLSSMEFSLKWVSEYGAALDAILSGEFDVCLLDYLIKERNGLELMQEAVSRGAMAPVIFLTGERAGFLDLEAISKGADDWLTQGRAKRRASGALHPPYDGTAEEKRRTD